MKYLLVVAGVCLGLVPGLAFGQFAAPSLLPAEFVTTNPAAMNWGAPSRVGIGMGRDASNAPGGPESKVNGTFGGIRGVFSGGAAALEGFSTKSDDPTFEEKQRYLSLGLALGIGPRAAIGVSGTSLKIDKTVPSVADQTIEFSDGKLGGSLRLGEVFYVGVSYDRADVDLTDHITGASGKIGTIETTAWGVGLSGGKELRGHIEFHREDAETKPDLPGATTTKSVTTVGVLEAGYQSLVVGVQAERDYDADTFVTKDSTTLALAYAPLSGGISVQIEGGTGSTKDATGTKTKESRHRAITLLYLF